MTLSTRANAAAWVVTAAYCTPLVSLIIWAVWPPMMAPFLFAGRRLAVGPVVGLCIGRAIRSRGP
jgi:hypothetical protein